MKRIVEFKGTNGDQESVKIRAEIKIPNGNLTEYEIKKLVGAYSDKIHQCLREGGPYGFGFYAWQIK